MKRELLEFGAFDCHSHAYGPYARFSTRGEPHLRSPESPIELREQVWKAHGIDRAVLIHGSAYGTDHAALLNAVARKPEHRRGVALLSGRISDAELIKLH